MLKQIILITGFIAVLIMLFYPGSAANNTSTATATASISETISVTLSTVGSGIEFENLVPGTPNQTTKNGDNLTIIIDPVTNVITNITQKGNASFLCSGGGCALGVDNFAISNLSYANAKDLDSAINMSTSYVVTPFANWTSIPKPITDPEVRFSEYWLDVPLGQSAGSYQTSLYINVSK